jgi:hypothetical protein
VATLKFHWKLDDATGTVATEEVASNDMNITVVSGSPNWVTGGLQFNGETYGATGTPRAIAETLGYAGCNIGTTGATFVVQFKLAETTAGMLFSSCIPPAYGAGPKLIYGFYIGTDAKLYFAGTYTAGGGADAIAAVASSGALSTDVVYAAVCTISPGPSGWLETLTLWLDASSESSVSVATTLASKYSASNDSFYLGLADLYSSSSFVYWPGVGTAQPNTIDATIYDAQFYCGVLTDPEIENLFGTDVAITGVGAIGQVGTPIIGTGDSVSVLGVEATGAVGTVASAEAHYTPNLCPI